MVVHCDVVRKTYLHFHYVLLQEHKNKLEISKIKKLAEERTLFTIQNYYVDFTILDLYDVHRIIVEANQNFVS